MLHYGPEVSQPAYMIAQHADWVLLLHPQPHQQRTKAHIHPALASASRQPHVAARHKVQADMRACTRLIVFREMYQTQSLESQDKAVAGGPERAGAHNFEEQLKLDPNPLKCAAGRRQGK